MEEIIYGRQKKRRLHCSAENANKGVYTFFLVLGFITGVLWGALSIRHYVSMNNCIREEDAYGAWEGAKKVRMFALIGVGVNVLLLLLQFAMNAGR